MITDYLLDLLGALHLPASRRRRIAAEVEDHLHCAAAELRASGLDLESAEREAIRRFGPARELAQAFLEDEAAASGHSAGRAASLLAGLLVLVAASPGGLSTWSFPAGLTAFVAGQVALVTGGLTMVRLLRARSTRGPRGQRLTLVLRGAEIVLACAAATLVSGLAVIGSRTGSPSLQSYVSMIALGFGVTVLARALRRGRRCARAACAPRAVSPTAEEDALADLAAVGRELAAALEQRSVVVRAMRRRLSALLDVQRVRAPRATPWLDLRHHPWRFACTLAVGAGSVLAVAHVLGEGGPPPPDRLLPALSAALLIASIEAAAVLLGFLALGRLMGIRSGRVRLSDHRG